MGCRRQNTTHARIKRQSNFFVMNVVVLCYNKHTDPTKLYNALCIFIPEANLKKCSNVA